MNLIELLTKSRKLINHCIGKFPMGEVELYEAEKLRDKIDEFLAKPAPDAMEIVDKVREHRGINGPVKWVLSRPKAAALIESRRVVLRAMLVELVRKTFKVTTKEGGGVFDMAKIAAKHGYKVEG